jgi:hypothetical protein
MGISRGQIDGQENGFDATIGYKWYGLPNTTRPPIRCTKSRLLHQRKLWRSLSAQEKQVLIGRRRMAARP